MSANLKSLPIPFLGMVLSMGYGFVQFQKAVSVDKALKLLKATIGKINIFSFCLIRAFI